MIKSLRPAYYNHHYGMTEVRCEETFELLGFLHRKPDRRPEIRMPHKAKLNTSFEDGIGALSAPLHDHVVLKAEKIHHTYKNNVNGVDIWVVNARDWDRYLQNLYGNDIYRDKNNQFIDER